MAKELSDGLRRLVERITKETPETFDFLLVDVPEIIKRRTRVGKGVDNKELVKLKPLSANYIKYRKGEMTFFTNKRTKKPFPVFNTQKTILQVGRTTKKQTKIGYGKLNMQDKFKKPQLSSFTAPEKSNLTLTGAMLDDIYASRGGTRYVFSFNDEKNRLKAKYARESGRNFFELSRTEMNRVIRDVQNTIKSALRNIFGA